MNVGGRRFVEIRKCVLQTYPEASMTPASLTQNQKVEQRKGEEAVIFFFFFFFFFSMVIYLETVHRNGIFFR